MRGYLGFLSEAPLMLRDGVIDTRVEREPGEPYEPNPPKKPPANPPACNDVADNDGISELLACCGGGTSLPVQHDDCPGGHPFQTMAGTCGSSSAVACAGRCGPDCRATAGYYQDCLDHDHCLAHDGGIGYTPFENCGDEWYEAVDDFAYAYLRNYSPVWLWLLGAGCA